MNIIVGGLMSLLAGSMFAAAPASTNYTIPSYDFGNGGGTGSSTTYKVNGTTGTQSGTTQQTSTSYQDNPGQQSAQQTNTPPAPSLTNPLNSYNTLKLVLDNGNNASDTKFAVAISDDNFASAAKYIKSDNSLGATLVSADWRTYASWGSSSGVTVLGLTANKTYAVKVKAIQGELNESPYGPTASAATIATTLSFSVATTSNGTPPYSIAFSGLTSGSVASSGDDVVASVTANALSGGAIYIKDSQSGLTSISQSLTLSSSTADLTSVNKGYGAQVVSTAQTLGGPISSLTPYNG